MLRVLESLEVGPGPMTERLAGQANNPRLSLTQTGRKQRGGKEKEKKI